MARLSPFSSASAGTVTVTVAWLGASSVMYSSLWPASRWMKHSPLPQSSSCCSISSFALSVRARSWDVYSSGSISMMRPSFLG